MENKPIYILVLDGHFYNNITILIKKAPFGAFFNSLNTD
jgi:hypothetical protein